MNDDEPRWGYWGDDPPCLHLLALRAFLEANRMEVWSEEGLSPEGWVNVSCDACRRAYETVLRDPWNDDEDDD